MLSTKSGALKGESVLVGNIILKTYYVYLLFKNYTCVQFIIGSYDQQWGGNSWRPQAIQATIPVLAITLY